MNTEIKKSTSLELQKEWVAAHRYEILAKHNSTIKSIKAWNRMRGDKAIHMTDCPKGRGDKLVIDTHGSLHSGFEGLCLLALSLGCVIWAHGGHMWDTERVVIRTHNNYARGSDKVKYHRWATDAGLEAPSGAMV